MRARSAGDARRRDYPTLLAVGGNDPDLRRKGRVLAVVLSGMAACLIALSVINVLQGQYQYVVSNGLSLLAVAMSFLLNRAGYVTIAALLTVALTSVGSLLLLLGDTLSTDFIVTCIPVFIASFLLVPWSGLVVAASLASALLLLGMVSGSEFPSLLALVIISLIAYLFSKSLTQAYHHALHDFLTGLPSRTLFGDRLQQSIERKDREPGTSALLFVDLDGFKAVNDSLGHELGDELLIEAARRLQSCLRSGDTAARLGGGEFTDLLDCVSEARDAVGVAERISERLRAPFELTGGRASVTASIGIVLNASAEVTPNDLLRNADAAMYEAKEAGKSSYKVFDWYPPSIARTPTTGREARRGRRVREAQDLPPSRDAAVD